MPTNITQSPKDNSSLPEPTPVQPPPQNDVPTTRRSRGTAFPTALYIAALVTASALIAQGTQELVREGVWDLNPSDSASNADTSPLPTTQSTTIDDPITKQIQQLEDKIKQLLSDLPKAPLAEEQALKDAMKAHKELAQAHMDEVNKITSNGTSIQPDKIDIIYKHAKGALFHNNGDNRINEFIKPILKNITGNTMETLDRKEATSLIKLSTEAAYIREVSGENSTANAIWASGKTNSVSVGDVTTKFHMVKATNTTESQGTKRLVMFFPGRSEPMEIYKELVMEVHHLGFDALVMGFPGNGDTGIPGHVSTFSDYTNGAEKIILQEGRHYQNITAIAHSTGGTILARVVQQHGASNIDQAFMASPMFGLSITSTQEKVVVIADRVLGFFSNTVNGIRTAFGYDENPHLDAVHIASKERYYTNADNNVSQSECRYSEMTRIRDGHGCTAPTVSWLKNANYANEQALDEAKKFKDSGIKTTIFIASEDSAVDNEATKQFINATGATGITIDGSLHTMFQEADPYRAPMVTHILTELLKKTKTNNGTSTDTQ